MLGTYALMTWFDEPTQLELWIKADQSSPQHFLVNAQRGHVRIGLVKINDAHTLELSGQITPSGAAPRTFSKRLRCNNMTEWTAPLFARCYSQGLALFRDHVPIMAMKHQLDDFVRINIEVTPIEPPAAHAVEAIEKKLGGTVPGELIDLLSHRITINQSDFLSPNTFRPALEVMEVCDGQPEHLLDNEPKIKALYQGCLALFRQTGDGVGYALYEPKSGHCWWTHQESIASPRLLRFHTGEPMGIDRAMAFCIAATELYTLDEYVARTGEASEVTIDDLHPAPSLLLHLDADPWLEYVSLDPYKSFDGLTARG
jgi:hypothetical protein